MGGDKGAHEDIKDIGILVRAKSYLVRKALFIPFSREKSNPYLRVEKVGKIV